MNTDRWDAFTEKELSAIMLGCASGGLAITQLAGRDAALAYIKDISQMVDEIGERLGSEAESVRDMIAEIEEHRE